MATEKSPVTPSDVEATIPSTTGSICTKLNALWSLANLMSEWFDWLLTDDGDLSDEGKDFFSEVAVPVGGVIFWPMDVVPAGFLAANGATVSRVTYANLFSVYGTKYGAGDSSTTFGLPNMQRKFPLGASGTNVPGSTGGAEEVTLEVPNLPIHKPTLASGMDFLILEDTGNGTDALDATNENMVRKTAAEAFADIGEDEPFSILPPYFSGHWIVKF